MLIKKKKKKTERLGKERAGSSKERLKPHPPKY